MLALACFAIAVYLPIRCALRRRKLRAANSTDRLPSLRNAWLASLALALLGALLLPSRLILQKDLTNLAVPTGAVWLVMSGLCVLAWEQGRRVTLCYLLIAWTTYTLAGNEWLSRWWISRLQADYTHIDPLQSGPFDAVVVLGGSTDVTPAGQTQLTDAGDRVMLGARMFLNGRTQFLVTTGSRIEGLSQDTRDQSEHTAGLWRELGVPEDRIYRLGGRNTKEESQSIKKLIAQHHWNRLGLVTSAWHMSRALRLMQAQGLDPEPLPANFDADEPRWEDFSLVPGAGSFQRMHRATKEMLAGLVGR